MTRLDPARLTPEQRLAEVAELMATAYQRLRLRAVKQEPEGQNPLEDRAPVEAHCSQPFNTERTEVVA